MRHWLHRIFHRSMHERFCTCRIAMFVYMGREPLYPGEAMAVDEVEVITSG